MTESTTIKVKSPLVIIMMGLLSYSVYATPQDEAVHEEELLVQASAEEALQQQPGVSIITADDIKNYFQSLIYQTLSTKCPGLI